MIKNIPRGVSGIESAPRDVDGLGHGFPLSTSSSWMYSCVLGRRVLASASVSSDGRILYRDGVASLWAVGSGTARESFRGRNFKAFLDPLYLASAIDSFPFNCTITCQAVNEGRVQHACVLRTSEKLHVPAIISGKHSTAPKDSSEDSPAPARKSPTSCEH